MSFEVKYVVLVCMTLFGSQSLIDAGPVSLQERNQTRRDDYIYTPGVGAHKIYHRSVSWNVARRTCEEDGAYLVIINSVAEAEAVVRLFDKSYEWGVSVGLHDLYQEEEFVTIHGEPSVNTGFDVWVPGSPNNAGNNENCVSLKPSKKLDDVSCSNRRPFVCELHEDQCNMQMAQVSR